METLLFQYHIHVNFQGEQVFHLVEYSPNSYASYKIDGFGDEVLVRDFRSRSVNAIGKILDNRGKGVNEFSTQFNVPALLKLFQENSNKIRFDLYNSEVSDPEFRFWVAAGIGDEIPAYDYWLTRIAPLSEKHYSFLAVYKRPQSSKKAIQKNNSSSEESQLPSSLSPFLSFCMSEMSTSPPNS